MGYNQLAAEAIFDSLEDSLSPVQTESVVSWVERNCELPTGAITGKVQMKYIPYGREILECYADKTIRHLVLAFATQSAKTTLLILGMLFRIARDPEDALWIMANGDQARDFNKERFMAFVRHCKAVMDLVPRTAKGAVDKHLWGFLAQHYSSMVLNFGGAGSPANLASRPRGLIQQDEVDKFYDQLGFDAGTIALVEERQKTFHFPMSVKASSPTLADRMIWVEYLKTDQRKFHVPCPRCSREILLKFSVRSPKHGDCGVRWWHEHEDEAKTNGNWDMKKVRALAHYKCQECAGMIHSFERPDMLENGIWRPSNPNAETGRRGYQLSSLYSILGQETSLASIAVKFLLAKGLRSELQNFVNGWLAEPFDESMAYEQQEVTLELFEPQDIPIEDTVVLMAIDVQENGFWVVIRRFQRPSAEHPYGQSWLLYADFVLTEEALVELQAEYMVEGENVTADMARRPNQVGRMIIQRGWRGIWGSPTTRKFDHPGPGGTKTQRIYSVVKWRDPMLGTRWENRTAQRAAYVQFSKHDALDLVASLRYAKPRCWHHTLNVSDQYSRHLNSRRKRMEKNKKTGRPEWIWYEIHQDNHLADCENHVTIRALHLGLISPPPETEEQNAKS